MRDKMYNQYKNYPFDFSFGFSFGLVLFSIFVQLTESVTLFSLMRTNYSSSVKLGL